MHGAAVRLPCDAAGAVADALLPEAADGPEGTRIRVRAEDGAVVLAVEAETLKAMRAALQGMVRLADAAIRVASAPRPTGRTQNGQVVPGKSKG